MIQEFLSNVSDAKLILMMLAALIGIAILVTASLFLEIFIWNNKNKKDEKKEGEEDDDKC